jgi:hypothetical protein
MTFSLSFDGCICFCDRIFKSSSPCKIFEVFEVLMAEGILNPSPEDDNDRLEAKENRVSPLSWALNRPENAPTNPSATSPGVTPFPVPKEENPTPILPKVKPASAGDRRQAANPEFTMNLLQEIQQTVANWQQELQSLHEQIEDLYREGPMINGWLESHSRESNSASRPPSSAAALRHADIDDLMAYIEQLSQQEEYGSDPGGVKYQLCGLDEKGKSWSKPCPNEQIPSVSLAIARYQKLRQLLKRKQSLERRITQLSENLIVCCGNLREEGK